MKKSDLLDTLTRLRPFAGTTHVNRLLDATGMESLERPPDRFLLPLVTPNQ